MDSIRSIESVLLTGFTRNNHILLAEVQFTPSVAVLVQRETYKCGIAPLAVLEVNVTTLSQTTLDSQSWVETWVKIVWERSARFLLVVMLHDLPEAGS